MTTSTQTDKITHVAMFADPAARVAIQETGASAEAAIAAAVKATGAEAGDFVAIPVTPRMSALLESGAPTRWVDLEDGRMDCEVDYAVFVDDQMIWNADATAQIRAYRNLHGQDIQSDDATDAAIEALDECGVPLNSGGYLVVSYPRDFAFEDLFEEVDSMLHKLRHDVNPDLIVEETVELDEEE